MNAVAEPDTAVNFAEYPSPASYKTPPETLDSAPALSSTRCGNGEEAERSMDWELFTHPRPWHRKSRDGHHHVAGAHIHQSRS
ncbi:hypothetical protein IEE92_04565 [Kocuria sp. cx-116]|uniref:hypothetical protein n=1 Tax=Kocuria sp. cx-116 TaxID=2771378 RepID=UPI00168416ED|nr:hypothetical protein [Kocuria sp. cx-116]MBD2761832.1 hypothetical protein [Kocuria sp. cx-116]